MQEALDASEAKDKDSQAKIADLGQRLNVALAKKVQELARYRSDFFGKLKEALGDRADFQVVGDRFVFPSDVLFDSGSAELKPGAAAQLDKLADALKQVETKIPPDIAWVMRVDGHTDIHPIATPEFPSNWELSSARAISVVRYLMQDGDLARASGGRGLRRIPADRHRDERRGSRQEPPHRAQAHRALLSRSSLRRVGSELQLREPRIDAALADQALMRTLLDEPPVVEHEDAVAR